MRSGTTVPMTSQRPELLIPRSPFPPAALASAPPARPNSKAAPPTGAALSHRRVPPPGSMRSLSLCFIFATWMLAGAVGEGAEPNKTKWAATDLAQVDDDFPFQGE